VATPAGRSLAERAAVLEREIHALASELDHLGARPEGAVRLSAPDGLGLAVFAPRLEEFRRQHPGLDLLLVAETPVVNLSRREADLAVRFVRPREEEDLVIRRLATVRFGLYASAGYLRRHPEALPGTPQDLVMLHESMDEGPESAWLRSHAPGARVRIRVRSTLGVRAGVLAGAGAGMLPAYLADDPSLRPLAPPAVAREVFLVLHRALRSSARVKAVGRFVADCLRRPGPRDPGA
jgi:DNA-binding transcriptional LysR family regulator